MRGGGYPLRTACHFFAWINIRLLEWLQEAHFAKFIAMLEANMTMASLGRVFIPGLELGTSRYVDGGPLRKTCHFFARINIRLLEWFQEAHFAKFLGTLETNMKYGFSGTFFSSGSRTRCFRM